MSDKVPEGWSRVRLGDAFDCWGGLTPSTSVPEYWGGTTPWVSSKDIKSAVVAGGTEFVTSLALAENRLRKCPPGSVLVVVRSGVLAHTLPVAITSHEVVVNQDVKALDSGDPRLNAWAAFYLRATQREILEDNCKDGTTVQSIRVPELLDRQMLVPPPAEQDRVVVRIEALLEQVRRARDRLDRVPLILNRFRKAVLTAACVGRLTEDWRSAHTNVNSRDSWTPAAPTNDLPDASEHLEDEEFPDSWTRFRVDALVGIQNGRAFPSKDYMTEGGVRLLRPGNLHVSGQVVWSEDSTATMPTKWAKEFPDFVLGEGELVMNLTAQSLKDEFLGRTCLKADRQPALLNQRIARFTNRQEFDLRPFLLLYFKSQFFRSFVNRLDTGSLIRHMHSKDVARHVVPVPPPEEMHLIVERATAMLQLCDHAARRVEAAQLVCRSLPQAILTKAFLGALVPTEAELARAEGRDYETADQLLERVCSAPREQASKGRRTGRARTATTRTGE